MTTVIHGLGSILSRCFSNTWQLCISMPWRRIRPSFSLCPETAPLLLCWARLWAEPVSIQKLLSCSSHMGHRASPGFYHLTTETPGEVLLANDLETWSLHQKQLAKAQGITQGDVYKPSPRTMFSLKIFTRQFLDVVPKPCHQVWVYWWEFCLFS